MSRLRVAITDEPGHEGLIEAVRRRPRVELVIGRAAERVDADVALAIDDLAVVSGPPVRRYLRHGTAPEADVAAVSTRGQLVAAARVAPDGVVPRVAPLPVEVAMSAAQRSGVYVGGAGPSPVREVVAAGGHSICDDPHVAEIAVVGPHDGGLFELRRLMALGCAVLAVAGREFVSDTIRHGSDGLVAQDLHEVAQLLDTIERPFDTGRLGYEAQVAIAAATWDRVVRALLVRPLVDMPRLDAVGTTATRHSWQRRLGHAVLWSGADVREQPTRLELSDAEGGASLHLGPVSPLRVTVLRRATHT